MTQATFQGSSGIVALLGPTNTGKTHRAIERMLEHESGMLGLPLRLLAREVYDRITERIGEQAVALLTGEEKRIPVHPRYWICTVEAMPMSVGVDFLGVDEIQLCAHPQRGHVFTDRLLSARGRLETWFMGSDTMRPLINELVPEARFQRHPRLSELRSVGRLKLSALPPRTALIGFSAARVYELGERFKLRRGGAAIVMGALSPRARNAQVALYQSGEVKYMVATDAIGMGLNLDIDHISFADVSKFDGAVQRDLDVPELAQIAGRAGRHLQHGTFGTLFPGRDLSPDVLRAIERHRFFALRQIYWRNPELDFRSLDTLLLSLQQPPPEPAFRRIEQAIDFRVLKRLAETDEIRKSATTEQTVALLWQVCQIPDFRQLLPEVHASLVSEVFSELIVHGQLSSEWLRLRVKRLDNGEGDIDTLLARLAGIRTWTYVANHSDWVEHASAWQRVTRDVEDRLSDALHARLVERFVERGKLTVALDAERATSKVSGFGSPFQSLGALRAELGADRSPAARSPAAQGGGLVERLIAAPFERFLLDAQGRLQFEGRDVGRLTAGQSLLAPEVAVSELTLGAGERSRMERRLRAWSKDLVQELFGALGRVDKNELSGAARGLLYQLEQRLGSLLVRDARAQLSALTEADRKRLRDGGVRIGRHVVYVESTLTPFGLTARAALCHAYTRRAVPALGELSLSILPGWEASSTALGYWALGQRALRVDYVERLSNQLYLLAKKGSKLPEDIREALGGEAPTLQTWLTALGFRLSEAGDLSLPTAKRRRRWFRSRAAQ